MRPYVISSYCSGGNCVKVWRTRSGNVKVGSTRSDQRRHEVTFTPDEWDVFVKGVKAGEFDLGRLW